MVSVCMLILVDQLWCPNKKILPSRNLRPGLIKEVHSQSSLKIQIQWPKAKVKQRRMLKKQKSLKKCWKTTINKDSSKNH